MGSAAPYVPARFDVPGDAKAICYVAIVALRFARGESAADVAKPMGDEYDDMIRLFLAMVPRICIVNGIVLGFTDADRRRAAEDTGVALTPQAVAELRAMEFAVIAVMSPE